MAEDPNPLVIFFQAVMSELRKKLTPKNFADLLEDCKTEQREEDITAVSAATPRQPPMSHQGDCQDNLES